MNRRQFLLAPAALGIGRAQTAELPDMLLNYFARRLETEVRPSAAARETLRRISGPYPERTPLNPQVLRSTSRTGYRVENVLFESRPGFVVNGNLYVPGGLTAPAPAIVMPRGHFDPERMDGDYQQICFDLVTNGFVVLSFDPIGQGERRQQWTEPGAAFDSLFSTSLEHALIGNLLALLGESSAGWQAWDGMRAIDYLLTRPEVDPKKIGCADHSDNGSETSILCALDDRITCSALHAPRFAHRWPVDRTTWTVLDDTQEYLPGAATAGLDIADIFAATAPRPLLVLIENPDGAFGGAAEQLARRHSHFAVVSADTTENWPRRLRLETVSWFTRWFGGPAPLAETDVVPELRSVLSTPNPGRSIYSLIREEAVGLPPANVSLVEVRQLIKPLPPGKQTAQIMNSVVIDSVAQDRLYLPAEPGIWLPATLYHPAKANGKIILYVAGDVTALDPGGSDDDTSGPAPDMTCQKLAAKGYTALSVDVRGIGATAPRIPRRGFRVPYHHLMNRDMAFAAMAWSLNDSLFAMRVRDVLRAVDFSVGMGAEIWLAGRDMGAQWAIFAAALDPRVKGVIAQNGLASWRTLLDHDRYQQASSQFQWGMLKKCDLPQVTELIAPRQVIILSPTNHNRQVITPAEAEAVYRGTGQTANPRISFSRDIADGVLWQ